MILPLILQLKKGTCRKIVLCRESNPGLLPIPLSHKDRVSTDGSQSSHRLANPSTIVLNLFMGQESDQSKIPGKDQFFDKCLFSFGGQTGG